MREFFTNPFAGVLSLVLLLMVFMLLTACKTAPQEATARLAVSYATAKYIEKAGNENAQHDRAVRVIGVLDLVENLAAGDSVTIDVLRAYVAQRLPADLSPADRVLAGTLIDLAAQELKARVGEGALKPDTLVKVKSVLQWIREGAAYYLPTPTT